MGLIAYHLNTIRKKFDTKGSKSLTAQEMAVMTRQNSREQEDDDRETGNEEDDTLSLEDDTAASKRASGFGFFSWVGGLFSDDIAFWFHGTQIKGKDQHQVRGGPVPLFKGAVLDLTPASMEGSISREEQKVYPWHKGGTPAKLVISPVGSGFITEHPVQNFMMKAPKNGEVDTFEAEISVPVSYNLGNGDKLEAQGARLDKEQLVLENPKLESGGELENAAINESGITLVQKAQESQNPEESKESLQEAVESGEVTVVTDSSNAETAQETPAAKRENEQADDSENEEENEDENDEENDEEERAYIDLANQEINIAGEDQSLAVNAKTGDVSASKGDVEFSANLIHKTFKFSWGKGWSSDDEEEESDEEGEEENSSSDKTLYETAKEAVAQYYSDTVSNSKDALEKLGFAKDALIVFFRTGELPENKYDDEEKEEKSGAFGLDAEWPILPGLSFVASLEPEWSFGFHFDFELAESDEAPKIVVEMEEGRVKTITAPDIKRMLSLTAEATGKIGATLRLALQAGVGYLFYLQGGLFAKGEAKGILADGSEDAFGKGRIELPITMEGANRKIKTGDASMELDVGVGLFGSVGGDIKAASEIFDWEKELWSITFKEWNPANFQGAVFLKQDKSKGGLLNPRSWEKEKSEFSMDLFKKHIEKQKKYGLVMTDAKPINTKIEESRALKDRLVEIHNRLTELEAKMSTGGAAGGQFAAQNSEAYDALVKELEQINKHLGNLMLVGNNKLTEMTKVMLEYQQDKHYQKNTQNAQAGKSKHEERLQKMQEWGGQFGEGQEEARSNSAYTYYENAFNAKGASRQKKEAHLETAKNSVATKEALLSYEEERVRQLGKKHTDRLAALTEMLDGMSEEQKNSPNPEFLEKYKSLGGTAFLETVQQYAGKERLIAYEQERLAKYNQKHKERAAKLENQLGESGLNISVADRKKPNRAFAEYYYKEMKGKRFFSEDQIIYNHQNGAEIVNYEQERLKDRAGKNMEHIEKLEQFKVRYDNADATEEEKEAVMKEAQKYYETTGAGRLGHFGQGDAAKAAAASKQDILDYEIRRMTEYQAGGGKKQKSYAAEKEALARLSGVSATDTGSGDSLIADLGKSKVKQVWDSYKEWLKGQEDETVKELIPLPMILEYESGKKAEIQEQLSKKKKTNAQIEADKDYKKHQERYQMLENKRLELKDEQNQETIEKETKKVKEAYFSTASEFFKKVKSGDRKDSRLLKAVLERKMEGYGGVHADRLTRLREFMGLASDSSDAGQSSKSDAQVWEYYKSMGAGDAFAEDFAKRRNGSFSIDDMLRYEQHAARENSRTNALKAAAGRKARAKIADYTTKEGGAEVEEKEKKAKEGGHYERYTALKAKLESGASDQEMISFYLEIGGGKGYVKSLMKGDHFLDVVTPEEILGYEQTRNGKQGERHAKRLEMLAGLDDAMSDEDVYKKYQESVLEDHGAKEFASKVGMTQHLGFDGTVLAEEVVTPQMIFDYEKQRLTQLTQKHTLRIERLSSEDVTAENALSVYQAEGGGEGFFGANKEQIKEKTSEIGSSHDYQDILDYEQARIAYYQNIMDEINEPLKRIEDAQNQLQEQMDVMKAEQMKLQKYLSASASTEVFSSRSAFETFTEETTGSQVQSNVDNGEAQVDALVKTAEDAQQEAEQIRERMKLSEEL